MKGINSLSFQSAHFWPWRMPAWVFMGPLTNHENHWDFSCFTFGTEGSQHEAGTVIVLDIFQSGVTSIRWWTWFMKTSQIPMAVYATNRALQANILLPSPSRTHTHTHTHIDTDICTLNACLHTQTLSLSLSLCAFTFLIYYLFLEPMKQNNSQYIWLITDWHIIILSHKIPEMTS